MTSATLVAACGLVALEYREVVTSTMDEAHSLAQRGAPAGTAVMAARQEQGRGRSGRFWQSDQDAGLWLTLIERPTDVGALNVLSLRAGLDLAIALAPLVDGTVRLKWPNDLFVENRKLAGILVEARWRDGKPEWAAIGVGINRRAPELRSAASVRSEVTLDNLLMAVVPALRRAAAGSGSLTSQEREEWAERDMARGRYVSAPVKGIVEGISSAGAVLIRDSRERVHAISSGSLCFLDD